MNLNDSIPNLNNDAPGGHSVDQYVPKSKSLQAETTDQQPTVVPSKEGQDSLQLNNLELKFIKDKETDKMTVFVVDKATKNVLRSIPPEELEKMNAGDLLKISA